MIAALGGSAYALATAPFLPWWLIALLGGAAVLMLAPGVWRRARGIGWRVVAVAMLLVILVNPSLVEEKRSPLRDVAVVVVAEPADRPAATSQRSGAGGLERAAAARARPRCARDPHRQAAARQRRRRHQAVH